ncbi:MULTISPECIES: GNAT family N-acetyltransferase [unclassified Shewanella]|uniref:GNAT family N-acetyltransferase n=1 Tax=unclassified Shewanella TaxID=196818 RepID=UPI0013000A5E|nr:MULTISPECIES: GNAT family N-acetyltransferase [unclassified Shewanella]MDO6775893.1 GNAT family N-acetyltransferase [Shewanella sp. 3_MG-2023]
MTSSESASELTSQLSALLIQLMALLTPAVVNHLPANFQQLNSLPAAEYWLDEMLAQSRLCRVDATDTGLMMGLVFMYLADEETAHIGYLLGEHYWKKGYGSELLTGVIEFSRDQLQWRKLIAGVDKSNQASAKLLLKLGFTQQAITEQSVIFYEYILDC